MPADNDPVGVPSQLPTHLRRSATSHHERPTHGRVAGRRRQRLAKPVGDSFQPLFDCAQFQASRHRRMQGDLVNERQSGRAPQRVVVDKHATQFDSLRLAGRLRPLGGQGGGEFQRQLAIRRTIDGDKHTGGARGLRTAGRRIALG